MIFGAFPIDRKIRFIPNFPMADVRFETVDGGDPTKEYPREQRRRRGPEVATKLCRESHLESENYSSRGSSEEKPGRQMNLFLATYSDYSKPSSRKVSIRDPSPRNK